MPNLFAAGQPDRSDPAKTARAPRSARDHLVAMLFTVAGLGLLGLGWSVLCTVPGVAWNAPRLAPSFALAHGLPVYALRSSGAQLGWIYGPVFPLWFLPITLPQNLTVALMLAGALNVVTLVLPVFLTVRMALGGHGRVAGLATLLGAALLMANWVTQTAFFYVHVDAVCIALGLVAAGALHVATARGSAAGWHVAALAVVLAIWTKQLAIALVPAMLVWLWREGRGRQALTWLKWLVIYGAGVTVVFFLVFGSEELLFNLWLLPARNPSEASLALLGTRLWEVVSGAWLWWIALGVGWWIVRSSARPALPAVTRALVRLLGWMAVWQIPLGLTAALKIGGGTNSFHSVNYALVAALVVGAGWLVQEPTAQDLRVRARAILFCATLALLSVAAGFKFAVRREAIWRPDRGQEELLAYARSHAGKLYLPWNPLITIISDRKIYPFDDALLCLWRAGLEPPRDAIRSSVPAGAEVLYQASNQSHFALSYFGGEAGRLEPAQH